MLEMTGDGKSMSGIEAIEFFERVADMIDEDAKTEEFCNEYTWALNRLRYLVRIEVPIVPKAYKGRFTTYSCGACGHGVDYGANKYCPGCGRPIEWHPEGRVFP